MDKLSVKWSCIISMVSDLDLHCQRQVIVFCQNCDVKWGEMLWITVAYGFCVNSNVIFDSLCSYFATRQYIISCQSQCKHTLTKYYKNLEPYDCPPWALVGELHDRAATRWDFFHTDFPHDCNFPWEPYWWVSGVKPGCLYCSKRSR